MDSLNQFGLIAELRPLTVGGKFERDKCADRTFGQWTKWGKVFWRQQSRRNTKYFQPVANNRFRRNFLGSIESEGMVYDDPGQIRPTFSKHI